MSYAQTLKRIRRAIVTAFEHAVTEGGGESATVVLSLAPEAPEVEAVISVRLRNKPAARAGKPNSNS